MPDFPLHFTTYQGYPITLNAHGHFFAVPPDPTNTQVLEADTYEALKVKLDSYVKRNSTLRKVKLAVLVKPIHESNATSHTLTGLHAATGHFNASPSIPHYGASVFPDHPKILTLLHEIQAQEATLQTLKDRLYQYEIDEPTYMHGRHREPEPEDITKLEAAYQALLTKLNET